MSSGIKTIWARIWVGGNIGELPINASVLLPMPIPQVVIDTNVVIAGLRSRNGSAFHLLGLVGSERFKINLSVPLILEYEEVLLRELPNLAINASDVQDFLDFHCAVATHHQIFFLWRPFLPDPKDDMVLELAVKAGCDKLLVI